MPRDDSRRARRHRREEGQALVEFALILPLFLLIVIGIIQFGLALNFWLDLQRIANQGARWAVVNKFPGCNNAPNVPCGDPTLQEYLAQERYSGGPDSRACVEVIFPAGTRNVGDPVTVQLAFPFDLGMPMIGAWSIKLSADATMRLEQTPGRYDGGPPGSAAALGGTTC